MVTEVDRLTLNKERANQTKNDDIRRKGDEQGFLAIKSSINAEVDHRSTKAFPVVQSRFPERPFRSNPTDQFEVR
jgi:hypothetical protein